MVIAKSIKSVQSYRFYGQGYLLVPDNYRRSTQYNSHSNSDSDDDVEFFDIDLSCNKLSVQLLANTFATCTKKHCINQTVKEAGEAPMTNVTQEKKVSIKRIGKKSLKALVPISGFVSKPPLDI